MPSTLTAITLLFDGAAARAVTAIAHAIHPIFMASPTYSLLLRLLARLSVTPRRRVR